MVKSPPSHPNKSGVLRQLELSISFIHKINSKEVEADSCFLPKGGRVGLSEWLHWREAAASTEFRSPPRTDVPSRSGYEVQNNSRALETCSFVEIKNKTKQNTKIPGVERMKWLPKGHTAPLKLGPPKGRAHHELHLPSGFVWKSDSMSLCAKGPETIQFPKRALLITDEHQAYAR